MIKWVGFGKLLKQSFFTLLISCFILLGGSFVSANRQYFPIGLDKQTSYWNSAYDVGVLKKGRFLTSYLGTTKNLIALSEQYLIFWTPQGGLYLFDKFSYDNHDRINQGYFQYIKACDEYQVGSGTFPTNCSAVSSVDYVNSSVVSNFMSNLVAGDMAYIEDGTSYSSAYMRRTYSICFSSQVIFKTLCFVGDWSSSSSDGYNANYPLTGNQHLDSTINFSTIPSSYLSEPPNFNGGVVDGGSQNVSDSSVITGNVSYSTCTKQRALDWYLYKGYNRNLCYSSYSDNSQIYLSGNSYGGFAIPGTDILDVWFDTWSYRRYGLTGEDLSYEAWFQYWRKSWDVYKHNPDINNPFVGVPVSLFTLMGNINSYGMAYSNASILEFCDLLLYTEDLTKPYSGLTYDSICNISAIDLVVDSLGVHAESGHIVQGSSWEGITNRTRTDGSPTVIPQWGSGYLTGQSGSGLSFFGDGKTFENNFFNLLSSSFKYPSNSGDGFLPGYIVLALCGLILFRFLRH